MGNHDVGRALSAAAKGFWKGKGGQTATKDEVLAFLDEVAGEFRGADAEFDDELDGDTPLARLIALAFDATADEIASLKGELESEDDIDTGMTWSDGPEDRFRKRYEFC